MALRDRKKELADKKSAYNSFINKSEEWTDEDEKRAKAQEEELSALKNLIARLSKSEEDDAANAEEPKAVDADDEEMSKKAHRGSGVLIKHARPANEEKGTRFIRYVLGAGISTKHADKNAGIRYISDSFGDNEVTKALAATSTNAVGGAIVPQDFRAELIDLLYAQSVVRSSGVQLIPMPMGNITIPKLDGGATAFWQGELDSITISQQAFTDLQFKAHKLTAMVPVSNDLIRYSPLTVESIVRNDMIRQIILKEDLAFLLGTGAVAGTGVQPIGLAGISGTTQITGGAATLAGVVATLRAAELALMSNNVSLRNAQWYFSPQVLTFINTLTDSTGRFFFADETGNGTLLGYKFNVSNQIPSNLGSGTNQSNIFFANVDDLMIFDTLKTFADSSSEATYGTTSAYQYDQTVFRVIEEVDFGTRHPASIANISVTGWIPSGATGMAGAAYVADPANTTLGSQAGSTHTP